MRRRPSFTEELEGALGSDRDRPPSTQATSSVPRAVSPPFVFAGPQPRFHGRIVGRAFRALAGSPDEHASSRRQASPPRSAHPLTATERRAFNELVALGADLPINFTRADLRRSFRSLARRYHPDRHPTSTPADRARLAAAFASVSDHYRCLTALLDRLT